MNTWSKPTFVLCGHHLLFAFFSCLPFRLFVCFLACLPSRLFTHILVSMLAISITFVCFMPLPYALCTFFFPLFVCWFVIFAFACTHMKRGYMELGHSFPGASKRGKDASMWIWAKRLQSVGLGFSFSLWLCTLLNPFYYVPNPKGSTAWEITSQSTCRFFFFFLSFLTIQSTKIISCSNIKNYHYNSIEYTLRVS